MEVTVLSCYEIIVKIVALPHSNKALEELEPTVYLCSHPDLS